MKPIAVVISMRLALWYAFIIILILVLNACGASKERRENVYREAQTVPKLQVPDDLEPPTERRSLMDVPEELDTGDIPKNLELPPVLAGIDLDEEVEEKSKVEFDEDGEPIEKKKPLKSEIVFKPDNTQILVVKSEIDTVWPRVANAIKSIGFKIDDSNRGKYYYSISREFERLKTFQDPSKPVEVDLTTPKEEHLIYVEPGEAYTEITVRNDKSEIEGTSLANQLLLQIKNHIEAP